MSREIVKMNAPVIIKQHNYITESYRDFTSTEQNILYKAYGDFRDDDPVNKIYTVEIKELARLTNNQLNYKHVRNAALKLKERLYIIQDGDKTTQVSILSAFTYRKGLGVLELEFSSEMRAYFFQLKNRYTAFQLDMAYKLQSRHSKFIYEMLCRWKDTGIMKVSVEEFKLRLGLIDPKTRKEQYTEFGLFAKKVLEVAQNELAEKTNISFTYVTIKTGKKITNLKFYITYKSTIQKSSVPALKPHLSEENFQKEYEIKNSTSHPKKEYEKLPKEQAEIYIKLIENPKKGGLGWLKNSRSLAFKLVKNVPVSSLWHYIGKVEMDVKSGNLTYSIPEYFKEILASIAQQNKYSSQKKVEGVKEINPSKSSEIFIYSIWRKMIHEFGINYTTADKIVNQLKINQVPYEELQHVMDKAFKTLQSEDIPNKEAFLLNEFKLLLNQK